VIRSMSKPGRWTIEELEQVVPGALAAGIPNPAPAAPPPAERVATT
jgi:hypothetical protein